MHLSVQMQCDVMDSNLLEYVIARVIKSTNAMKRTTQQYNVTRAYTTKNIIQDDVCNEELLKRKQPDVVARSREDVTMKIMKLHKMV
jgi:hypothetical protein